MTTPCERRASCNSATRSWRVVFFCFNASAAAVPAAWPVAMLVPMTRVAL